MTLARQSTGQRGEDLACEEMARRKYVIVARRYRTRHGEIDVIARSAGVLVFVEVKARHDRRFGDAAAAVTPQKQQRIARMAEDYLTRHRLTDTPCRFDVVAVDLAANPPVVTIIADAFRPGWD